MPKFENNGTYVHVIGISWFDSNYSSKFYKSTDLH